LRRPDHQPGHNHRRLTTRARPEAHGAPRRAADEIGHQREPGGEEVNVLPVHGRDEELIDVEIELVRGGVGLRLQPVDVGDGLGQQRRLVEAPLQQRRHRREARRDRAEVVEEAALIGEEPAHRVPRLELGRAKPPVDPRHVSAGRDRGRLAENLW
jgi:hypothetical protein